MGSTSQIRNILLGAIFLLSGCADNNESETKSPSDNQTNIKQDPAAGNDMRAFALPAPLQMATVVKNMNVHYMDKILVPAKKGRAFSSDYQRAINLGMYCVDVGYATVFEQRQTALNYYKTIDELLMGLNIAPDITIRNIKRFERNVNSTDSLCVIILESYNKWQNYFQDNKREEMGWYILSGTYIEGLHLTLSYPELQQKEIFENMIGQQKLFLDNILELSNYIDKKPEFDDLYLQLGLIQEAYASIPAIVKNDADGETVIACEFTSDQLKALALKVNEARSSFLK